MGIKICVCVKVVPRAAVQPRLDPVSFRLDRSAASEVNVPDEYAIEEAVSLRERAEAEIVVVTMGPIEGLEALRHALALGADRAVAVADPALEGSDLLVTSRVLAGVLEREAPDVVILGAATSDGGGAMMAGAVAERLRLPIVSGVRELDLVDSRIRGRRQSADGERVIEAAMPCVVGLSGVSNAPIYPSFRDLVQARRKEVAVLGLGDLGLKAAEVGWSGARTRVLGMGPPPARETAAEIVEDSGRGAAWLHEALVGRGLA